jgi:hypothetical protein
MSKYSGIHVFCDYHVGGSYCNKGESKRTMEVSSTGNVLSIPNIE